MWHPQTLHNRIAEYPMRKQHNNGRMNMWTPWLHTKLLLIYIANDFELTNSLLWEFMKKCCDERGYSVSCNVWAWSVEYVWLIKRRSERYNGSSDATPQRQTQAAIPYSKTETSWRLAPNVKRGSCLHPIRSFFFFVQFILQLVLIPHHQSSNLTGSFRSRFQSWNGTSLFRSLHVKLYLIRFERFASNSVWCHALHSIPFRSVLFRFACASTIVRVYPI